MLGVFQDADACDAIMSRPRVATVLVEDFISKRGHAEKQVSRNKRNKAVIIFSRRLATIINGQSKQADGSSINVRNISIPSLFVKNKKLSALLFFLLLACFARPATHPNDPAP